MKAPGKLALRVTPDGVAEILEAGQFVAHDKDHEHAAIQKLLGQRQAGDGPRVGP